MELINKNVKRIIITEYLNIYSFKKGLTDIYMRIRKSEEYRNVINKADIIIMIADVYNDNINYSKIREKYSFNIYKFLYETFKFFTKKKILYYNDYTKRKCLLNLIAFRELLLFVYKHIISLNRL